MYVREGQECVFSIIAVYTLWWEHCVLRVLLKTTYVWQFRCSLNFKISYMLNPLYLLGNCKVIWKLASENQARTWELYKYIPLFAVMMLLCSVKQFALFWNSLESSQLIAGLCSNSQRVLWGTAIKGTEPHIFLYTYIYIAISMRSILNIIAAAAHNKFTMTEWSLDPIYAEPLGCTIKKEKTKGHQGTLLW